MSISDVTTAAFHASNMLKAMDPEKSISFSELRAWMGCHAKHDYQYVGNQIGETLAVTQHANQDKMDEGKSWEYIMYMILSGLPYNDILAECSTKQARILASVYDDLEHFRADAFEFPVVFDDFFSFVDAVQYKGKVETTKHGTIHQWGLHETKFYSKLRDYSEVMRDQQLPFYCAAFEQMMGPHHQVVSMSYIQVLNVDYDAPAFNQDGALSKRQNCTPKDYADLKGTVRGWNSEVLAKLEAKLPLQKTIISPSQDDKAWYREQLMTAIHGLQNSDSTLPNPSLMGCRMCEYSSLCSERISAKGTLAQSMIESGIMEVSDQIERRSDILQNSLKGSSN